MVLSMTVEVAASVAGLPADARAWMDQAGQSDVEAGTAWFANLQGAVYPGHAGIRFYLLRLNGLPAALLPLRLERAGSGWHGHALANFYTTLYQPLVASDVDAAALAVLLAAVEADFAGIATLKLAPIDPAAPACQRWLAALRLRSWSAFDYFAFGNWYLPVTMTWPAYLASRDGMLRNTIKRMGKKFAAHGGRLQLVEGGQELEAAIAAYGQVYGASWKQPEPYPDFMPGLLRDCARHGTLRLGLAWLDGRPVAAQVWIVSGGRAAIYKLAYDETAKAHAPGTLLTALLMQHVIEVDQVREVDYLMGDDLYKQAWMSHRRERRGIIAYRRGTWRGLAGWLREVAGRAARRLQYRQR